MPARPFLDNWGRFLLAAGFGAGLMFLFLLMRWNPAFLGVAWLVALVGWLSGRVARSDHDSQAEVPDDLNQEPAP
jgi:hypothetical protein